MKVLILAGGLGTRISEYTEKIPKPMVQISDLPILLHIMDIFSHYGHNDFYIALGYKGEVIKNYFKNFSLLNKDFKVNLENGEVEFLKENNLNKRKWNVTLVDTGLNSLTGRRVKLMQPYLENETFFLTYGDGVSDIDLDKLLKFHNDNKKTLTITAVRPQARFGELEIKDGLVINFKEKPQLHQGWINGGFFVAEPRFFDYISDENIMLEREPLENLTSIKELVAYKHEGFWQCMDTRRDKQFLEALYKKGAPWIR